MPVTPLAKRICRFINRCSIITCVHMCHPARRMENTPGHRHVSPTRVAAPESPSAPSCRTPAAPAYVGQLPCTSTHPCNSCPCTQHHQAKAASCHRSIGQRSISSTPVPQHVNEHHRASALLRRCMIGPPISDPTAPPCQCVVQTGQHLRCSAPGPWAPMPPPAHRRSSADPCWQGRHTACPRVVVPFRYAPPQYPPSSPTRALVP